VSAPDDGVLISVVNADGSHKLGLLGGRLKDPVAPALVRGDTNQGGGIQQSGRGTDRL